MEKSNVYGGYHFRDVTKKEKSNVYGGCPYIGRKPTAKDCLECERDKCYLDENKYAPNSKETWEYDKLMKERGF